MIDSLYRRSWLNRLSPSGFLEALRRLFPQPAVPRFAVATRRSRSRIRAPQYQLELNDHLLKDIGLTRADPHYEASRRFLHW